MSDLLLKATRELLDGWHPEVLIDRTDRAIVVEVGEQDGVPAAYVLHIDAHLCREPEEMGWVPVADLYLDLARAECRDRVTIVVTQAHIRALKANHRPWVKVPAAWEIGKVRGFAHDTGHGYTVLFVTATMRTEYYQISIPPQPDLDPNDDTRLPDGSRKVDALALLVVAREVL